MYHKKNVDSAYLLWEDFVYQVENKNVKRSNEMCYPRFTKVIVNFFMTKDQSIPRRNKVNWHFARDDYMFTTIKIVSWHEDTQLYCAILPDELTNEAVKDSESYKEYYAIASGAEPPKTKASVKKKQTSAKAAKTAKKKQLAKTSKAKGLTVLYEKSNDEEDDDEVGMNEDDEDNDDDGDDADDQDDDDQENDGQNDKDQDDEHTYSDNDGDDFVHPKFSTHDEENKEEDSFYPRVQTPPMLNPLMMKTVMKKFKMQMLREIR
ncbi:hypothetical protein Tco_1292170 [Tanacetum coccineum]